jgi:hypothetical protein
VRVRDARNVDWEDIAIGPCEAGSCIYIGDIGDNDRSRRDVAIYVIPEPTLSDTVTGPATRIPVRYQDGPEDAEALFALPDGSLYIMTKGRARGIALYRVDASQEPAPLSPLQQITATSVDLGEQVTAAAATPDGRYVAIRTYASFRFFRVKPDGALETTLQQGVWPAPEQLPSEGIAVLDDGTLILTAEADPAGVAPVLELRCALPSD